jgi:hypothetical protein
MVYFPLLFTVSATLGAIGANAVPVVPFKAISKIPIHTGLINEVGKTGFQGVSTLPNPAHHHLINGVSKIPIHRGGEGEQQHHPISPINSISKTPFQGLSKVLRVGMAGAPRDFEELEERDFDELEERDLEERDLEEREPIRSLNFGDFHSISDIPVHRGGMRVGLAGAPRDLEYLEERSKVGNFFKKVGHWFKDNIGTVVDVGSKLAKVVKV